MVGLVRHLDMAQVLYAKGPFPAGDDHPDRVTLLNTQRLAILAIGHENVVEGLCQRKGMTKLARVRPFVNQPARLFFQAGLVQQHGKRHSGPFAATGHPVNKLDRQPHVLIARMMDQRRAVAMALQEMNPGYGRQALEILHAETQRTIHHAVNREAMLLRIDLGEVGGVLLHEVKLGRCDDSPIILKRSVESDVINAHSRPPARGDSSAQLFAGDEGILGWYFRLARLASCGPFSASAGAYRHTSQCSRVLEELPSARSSGFTHECLLCK